MSDDTTMTPPVTDDTMAPQAPVEAAEEPAADDDMAAETPA